MTLAQVNGMQLGFFDDMDYAITKAEVYLKSRDLAKFAEHFRSQVHKGPFASARGAAVSGGYLNLQVTLFMLGRALSERPCYLMGVYLLLFLFCNLRWLAGAVIYTRTTIVWYGRLEEASEGEQEESWRSEDSCGSEKEVMTLLREFKWKLACQCFFLLIYASLVIYAVVKLVVGWAACKNSVWNVT